VKSHETKPNKVERINHLLNLSKHYREQLAAMAAEFAELHQANIGTHDFDDFMGCILDGEEYDSVMRRVMNRRISLHAAEEQEERNYEV
jgi:flagellar motor component MotA